MKQLTVLIVDDWAGLWRDDELMTEGHSVGVHDLAHVAEGEPFLLVRKNVEGSKADEEVLSTGGFRGITLDKWLSLAEEPA